MQLVKDDVSIGVFHIPERKKPCLGILKKKDNRLYIYGQFHDDACADDFMKQLADFCCAVKGDD
ncbi:MAG: hypothetical protein J6S92_13625 [Oscillospiraceae bacterium]|nr:hypothetical protein [Bacteroidaceae bacterium]MBP0975275.1 hypothetical protein [Oscillospiraceae bacterium]MBP0989298.1 hypothetical protein [Oscillospiraceae bacterium]